MAPRQKAKQTRCLVLVVPGTEYSLCQGFFFLVTLSHLLPTNRICPYNRGYSNPTRVDPKLHSRGLKCPFTCAKLSLQWGTGDSHVYLQEKGYLLTHLLCLHSSTMRSGPVGSMQCILKRMSTLHMAAAVQIQTVLLVPICHPRSFWSSCSSFPCIWLQLLPPDQGMQL